MDQVSYCRGVRTERGWDSERVGHIEPFVSPRGIQCFGSVFIWSGSGSSILGRIPIRIRILTGSRSLMTRNRKKFTAGKKCSFLFKNCNLPVPRPP
jgi:hypothetical protein